VLWNTTSKHRQKKFMLTIKTHLSSSDIHGIGLFASEPIPAGAVIWKFSEMVDRVYSEKAFLKICRTSPEHCLTHFLNASYLRGGRYFYLTDNARFINHSNNSSNIAFVDDNTEVALRDISAGEELLEDYQLCYDATDFFFQELSDPDPLHYIQTVCTENLCYDYRTNIS